MSTKLHRFDFSNLRDFRAPIVVEQAPEIVIEDVPPPPPPPTFSEAELEAARAQARQEAFAEGFEAGMGRANEQAEAKRQSVDATILQLGGIMNGLRHEYHQMLHHESVELSQLVMLIAHKLTGILLDVKNAEVLAAMVAECLPAVLSKPKLTVELNPEAFTETIDRIEKLLHASGFEGELQFRSNDTIGMHDCVLDWGAGQARRDTKQLWQEIEALLEKMPLQLDLAEAAMDIPAETAEVVTAPTETPPTV